MSIRGGQRGWSFYIRYDEETDRAHVSRALLRRVATYARPYSGQIVLMLGLIILTSVLSLVPPLLYRDLLDNALPNWDVVRLNLLAVGVIGVPILAGLIEVAQLYLSATIGSSITRDLRCSLYRHVQRMSIRFFTYTKTGEMMSRLNNDVMGAQRALTTTLVNIVTNLIAVIGTLIVMVTLEWRLTLLGIAILPIFILPTQRVGNVLRRITRQQMELNAEMNALVNETLNIGGALLAKIFGREQDELERFTERADRVRDNSVSQTMVGRWFFLGMSLVAALGTALVFWIGGHLVLRGTFTIGTIIAFGTYLRQLYGPLAALVNVRLEFVMSMVSFERVFEVLDLPVEIQDRPSAVSLGRVEGHIRFDAVSFSYLASGQDGKADVVALAEVPRFGWRQRVLDLPKSGSAKRARPASLVTASQDGRATRRWTLRDVRFEIQPGQLVALVGPSGAGKTTVTYLIPRLYDPTEGRITLDSHDLRDVQLASLAANIGMVTQETYLFHDTVRANLLYAKPDATQPELEAACRDANIHELIMSLSEGYDTIVGERGYRLSGGEKQRLSIARVLLKDPRLLILDEATSHLDSESEALIQQALERVMQERTSLVIAHRLSTILSADLILVMDEGRLVEQGTHVELLERDGLYARLYHTQFRDQEAAAEKVSALP